MADLTPIPLPVHARVDFVSQGHRAAGVITGHRLTLRVGAQVETTIQEVVEL